MTRLPVCLAFLALLVDVGSGYCRDGGGTLDSSRAAAISCATGPQCRDMGDRFRNGKGATRDPARAVLCFEAGCAKEDSGSCLSLGIMLRGGDLVPRDERRALAAFQTACDLRNLDACIDLAGLYQFGLGTVPKDPVHAAEILQKTCDAGEGVACMQLAQFYEDGTGVKKNKKRAAALRKLAKEKGFVGD